MPHVVPALPQGPAALPGGGQLEGLSLFTVTVPSFVRAPFLAVGSSSSFSQFTDKAHAADDRQDEEASTPQACTAPFSTKLVWPAVQDHDDENGPRWKAKAE